MSAANEDLEKQFMNGLNFTDDMYDVITNDQQQPLSEDVTFSDNACLTSIYKVGQSYRLVHGHISLTVCIAGILMNILIIMVLTRKEMRTPINRMLTALAIADILVMIEYIPFSFHMYILDLPEEEQYSYSWAVFVLFHSHFTQILHTINIQLTISVAIWRYMALKSCGTRSPCLTLQRCNFCILAAYIFPIILCIPNYLTFSIYHREKLILQPPFDGVFKMKEVDPSNWINFVQLCDQMNDLMNFVMNCSEIVVRKNLYVVELSEMATVNEGFLHRVNFWIFSVFVKLIPCFVLTFFMCWLVNTLYKAKRRHSLLKCTSQVIPLSTIGSNGNMTESTRWNGAQLELSLCDDRKNEMPEQSEAEEDDNHETKEENAKKTQVKNNRKNHVHEKQQQEVPFLLSPVTESELLSPISQDENHPISACELREQVLKPSPGRSSLSAILSRRESCYDEGEYQSQSRHNCQLIKSTSGKYSNIKYPKKKHGTDRTSKLLIAVLCLFLVTEIPQGIMAFLSGIYGEKFFVTCYNTWAEVWDLLAILNSSINFILYCFMSKQFRVQFRSIFKIGKIFKHRYRF